MTGNVQMGFVLLRLKLTGLKINLCGLGSFVFGFHTRAVWSTSNYLRWASTSSVNLIWTLDSNGLSPANIWSFNKTLSDVFGPLSRVQCESEPKQCFLKCFRIPDAIVPDPLAEKEPLRLNERGGFVNQTTGGATTTTCTCTYDTSDEAITCGWGRVLRWFLKC